MKFVPLSHHPSPSVSAVDVAHSVLRCACSTILQHVSCCEAQEFWKREGEGGMGPSWPLGYNLLSRFACLRPAQKQVHGRVLVCTSACKVKLYCWLQPAKWWA